MRSATLSPVLAMTIIVLAALSSPAFSASDAERGKKVFKKCMACHQVGEGAKNRTGPVLTGIVGRTMGTWPDYSYGKSLRQARDAGLVWSEEYLDGWLTNPRKFLRKVLDSRKANAKMRFKLKKPQDRSDVIAYLKTVSLVKNDDAMMKDDTKKDAMKNEAMATAAMAIAKTDICIENQSDKTLLFVVDVNQGQRVLKTLEAGQNLCAPQAKTDGGGTVGVFVDENAMEGCSRLAMAGKAERLIAYEPFDNCTWAN